MLAQLFGVIFVISTTAQYVATQLSLHFTLNLYKTASPLTCNWYLSISTIQIHPETLFFYMLEVVRSNL